MNEIMVPVSPGELTDKITILRLKAGRMSDETALGNVRYELSLLTELSAKAIPPSKKFHELEAELQDINTTLWDIEDAIRAVDAQGNFDAEFVALARAVYRTNDRRAAVKKQINQYLGSTIIEEKSYLSHGGDSA